jgi:hypothetical protein
MNDIINIYQGQMKDDLIYNVIENYYYNLINIIDNYFINKELVKRCLNLHTDYDNNIIKILELENTNKDTDMIIYNNDNTNINKIIYNRTRSYFHTSIYNYFNYIRKDYQYNTTELLTFIYIQDKKIKKLEKDLINKYNKLEENIYKNQLKMGFVFGILYGFLFYFYNKSFATNFM